MTGKRTRRLLSLPFFLSSPCRQIERETRLRGPPDGSLDADLLKSA